MGASASLGFWIDAFFRNDGRRSRNALEVLRSCSGQGGQPCCLWSARESIDPDVCGSVARKVSPMYAICLVSAGCVGAQKKATRQP